MSWVDANLMRWSRDRLEPLAGWEKYNFADTASPVRRVHRWIDNTGREWTAYLCDAHIYVEYQGGLVDITPAGGMVAPSASFNQGGYGDDLYSLGKFGTPRPPQEGERPLGNAFTLNNWGQDLLAMTNVDGRLIRWTPGVVAPVKATIVPNAPITNRSFMVVPERYVILHDYSGKVGEFAWCDQENIENWNFADLLSKAGDLPIEPKAPTLGSVLTSAGVLTFTTAAISVISHIGSPYIFRVEYIGAGATPVSDRAIIRTESGAMWIGENGVWDFNGVSVSPIDCPLWNSFNDKVNWSLARQVANAVHVENKSEIWFFLPTTSMIKPDIVIIFNYKEGWWSKGMISRSAGFSSSFTSYPVMADQTKIYKHESGNSMDGVPSLPWIESHVLQDLAGQLTFAQLQPDIEGDIAGVRFSLKYQDQLATNEEFSSPLTEVMGGYVDFNGETGKSFRVRIECINPTVKYWSMGDSEADVKKRGKRK